tara:strand:+ start:274 stop:504 length:231 start_codon:yes stop_codon:yes gene_type:complete
MNGTIRYISEFVYKDLNPVRYYEKYNWERRVIDKYCGDDLVDMGNTCLAAWYAWMFSFTIDLVFSQPLLHLSAYCK